MACLSLTCAYYACTGRQHVITKTQLDVCSPVAQRGDTLSHGTKQCSLSTSDAYVCKFSKELAVPLAILNTGIGPK